MWYVWQIHPCKSATCLGDVCEAVQRAACTRQTIEQTNVLETAEEMRPRKMGMRQKFVAHAVLCGDPIVH